MQNQISPDIAALLADNLPDAAAIIQDGRPVFLNRVALESLGYGPDQEPPQSFLQMIHPEDRSEIAESFARKITGGRGLGDKVFRVQRADGGHIWVKSRSRLVRWQDAPALLYFFYNATEEQQAGQQLEESRSRYTELFESIMDIFYRTDREGRILLISPSVREVLGWSPDEALGKPITDFCVDPEKRKELLRRLAVMGSVKGYEATVRRKDGREIWVSGNISFWRDANGEIGGVQGLVREIEQQRRVEMALRNEKNRIQTYLDTAEVILLALDTKGRVERINRKGAELLGYGQEELAGKDWFETALPPEQRAEVKKVFKHLMAGDALPTAYHENQILHKRGQLRTIHWHNTLLHNQEGEICGSFSSGEDITAFRQTEAALKESQQRWQLLLDSVPLGVYELDRGGKIVLSNQSFARITGYPMEELLSMSVWDLLEPGPQQKELPAYFKYLANEAPEPSPYFGRNQTKDGRPVDVEVQWRYKRDDQGRVEGFFCTVNDITERLAANRARQRLEDQLKQAQKMEALGTLAGGIAHDFNNILGAIMGFTELALLDGEQGKAAPEELKEVLKAAQRAKMLVRRVLDFSRDYQSKLVLMDINQSVLDAANLLSRTLPKMIAITTVPANPTPTIRGDANRIEQILLNLASNAADAMPQGGELAIGVRHFRLEEQERGPAMDMQPGDYVALSIIDTGQGMDKDTMERVFDPFFSTKERGRGTGLGLSSVYGIAKEHGARVVLASEPGRGTKVEIFFPLAEGEIKRPESEPRIAKPSVRNQGKTILLVDDEQSIRELGLRVLSGAGFRVLVAESGEQALDLHRERKRDIDLVVLDLGMPGMGGIGCLERLREMDPGVKVVVATGYLPTGPLREYLQNRIQGFVDKPFRAQTLLGQVEQALSAES